MSRRFFESKDSYRERIEIEANEETIRDSTGYAPSRKWFGLENEDKYRDRIGIEADEAVIRDSTGHAPSKGILESKDSYRDRIETESNESIVRDSTGHSSHQKMFESDSKYDVRIRKEANEQIIEDTYGSRPRKSPLESDHDYRSRIAREAREARLNPKQPNSYSTSSSDTDSSIASSSSSSISFPIVVAAFSIGIGLFLYAQFSKYSDVMEAHRREIKTLNTLAYDSLRAGRLTGHEGNNALDQFKQVLTISPRDPKAIAGLSEMRLTTLLKAEDALIEPNFKRADQYISLAKEMAMYGGRINSNVASLDRLEKYLTYHSKQISVEELAAPVNEWSIPSSLGDYDYFQIRSSGQIMVETRMDCYRYITLSKIATETNRHSFTQQGFNSLEIKCREGRAGSSADIRFKSLENCGTSVEVYRTGMTGMSPVNLRDPLSPQKLARLRLPSPYSGRGLLASGAVFIGTQDCK